MPNSHFSIYLIIIIFAFVGVIVYIYSNKEVTYKSYDTSSIVAKSTLNPYSVNKELANEYVHFNKCQIVDIAPSGNIVTVISSDLPSFLIVLHMSKKGKETLDKVKINDVVNVYGKFLTAKSVHIIVDDSFVALEEPEN